MAGYYRLKELGFQLASGAHVLPKEAFEPVDAANALVDEARQLAGSIEADARAAFEAEKRRGYEEGLTEARLETARILLAETALLDNKLTEIEARLTDVVVTSVRRLVHGFSDREKAESLVHSALKQMRREKRAELRVSRAQYAELREAVGGIVKDYPEVELVDVVEDPTLEAPHIIVETAIGRVEGDLGRHLEDLERSIADIVGMIVSGGAAANGKAEADA